MKDDIIYKIVGALDNCHYIKKFNDVDWTKKHHYFTYHPNKMELIQNSVNIPSRQKIIVDALEYVAQNSTFSYSYLREFFDTHTQEIMNKLYYKLELSFNNSQQEEKMVKNRLSYLWHRKFVKGNKSNDYDGVDLYWLDKRWGSFIVVQVKRKGLEFDESKAMVRMKTWFTRCNDKHGHIYDRVSFVLASWDHDKKDVIIIKKEDFEVNGNDWRPVKILYD